MIHSCENNDFEIEIKDFKIVRFMCSDNSFPGFTQYIDFKQFQEIFEEEMLLEAVEIRKTIGPIAKDVSQSVISETRGLEIEVF